MSRYAGFVLGLPIWFTLIRNAHAEENRLSVVGCCSRLSVANRVAKPEFSPEVKASPGVESRSGNGVLIAAGAVSTLSWATWIGRIATTRDECGIYGCNYDKGRSVPIFAAAGWGLNFTTWVLAPIGGQRRAQYDVSSLKVGFLSRRRSVRFLAVGSALLSLGLAVNMYLRLDWAYNIGETDEKAVYAYIIALQSSSSMIAAGSGLLMYGLEYRREIRLIDRIRLSVGPGRGGLTVAF